MSEQAKVALAHTASPLSVLPEKGNSHNGLYMVVRPGEELKITASYCTLGDAHLYSAAPELLEALQHARGCVPFPSDCHTKIVAAIAKALGQEGD